MRWHSRFRLSATALLLFAPVATAVPQDRPTDAKGHNATAPTVATPAAGHQAAAPQAPVADARTRLKADWEVSPRAAASPNTAPTAPLSPAEAAVAPLRDRGPRRLDLALGDRND